MSNDLLSSLKIHRKRAIGFMPMVLITLAYFVISVIFVRCVENYAVKVQRNNFLSNVRILSAALDLEDIKSLTGREIDKSAPGYTRLKDQLARVIEANPRLRFVYFMGKKDKQIIFLVDNAPEGSKDYSPPGQVYEEASLGLHKLFEAGDGFVEGPLEDRWGKWVSALIPIKDSAANKTIAVMGLDVDASLWNRDIVIYRSFAFAVTIFVFGIIFISLFFIRLQRQNILKLAQAEERFRHVADGSGDWIWETDKLGLFTYSSRAARDILGYEPHEFVGKKYFYDFCFPEDKEKLREEALKQAQEARLFIRTNDRRQHKDGHEVILEIMGFALRNAKGEVVGYRGVDRDITELKKTERTIEESRKALETANKDLAANEKLLRSMIKDMEKTNQELIETQNQLIQSEKMATVGVLASGVAHEIKNPLAIILQGLERLQKLLSHSDQKGIEYLSMVRSAAERANKVITELLRFSRSSQLELQPADIHEVIDTSITLLENTTPLANIRITRKYLDEGYIINADSILLQQVFIDLLSNAIDAMPKGGEITIETRSKKFAISNRGDEMIKLIVEIKDTGAGIQPEHISRIFDPFFTTKEPGKGTGLGLSTAYLILEKHSGTIEVASTPGAGTTFTLSLPVLERRKVIV